MNRARTVVAALALAAASVGAASWSAERTGHDSHVERPTAGASAPLPLAAAGGEHPGAVIAQAEWIEGVQRAEWYEGVAAAEEQARQAALADLARQRPVRSSGGSVGSGDCAALAAEFGLPESILWRESRCSYDAYNATGCGGRGCIGAAQLDAGHFAAASPWGGVGACADLDPGSIADQQECTNRLSGGGSNLRPWGG